MVLPNSLSCLMHFTLRIVIIVGFNCLISCKPFYIAVRQQPELISVSAATTHKNPINEFLQPYRDSLNKLMDVPIAQASGVLIKERPAGSLGNFFSDAILNIARQKDSNVMLVIANYGGLRVNRWSEGPILVRNVYELMPFDNALVVLDLPGSVLLQWMEHMAKMGGWPVGGACISADTVQHRYYLKTSQSARLETINEKQHYRIATSDYIANGGDRCEFLIGQKQVNHGILLRDALFQYLQATKQIVPSNENRFTFQVIKP